MASSLKSVLITCLLCGVLGAATFHLFRDWQYARWLGWGVYFALSVLVWLPFVFVPYYRSKER